MSSVARNKERLAALAQLEHLSSTARTLVDGLCRLIGGPSTDEEAEDWPGTTSMPDEATRAALVTWLLNDTANRVLSAKWPYNRYKGPDDRKKALAGFLDTLAFVHGADLKTVDSEAE